MPPQSRQRQLTLVYLTDTFISFQDQENQVPVAVTLAPETQLPTAVTYGGADLQLSGGAYQDQEGRSIRTWRGPGVTVITTGDGADLEVQV